MPMHRIGWLACAGSYVLCNVPAIAADSVRVRGPALARGEYIARYQCSACHVVAKDQEFPVLLIKPAPAFSDIANQPSTSAKTLMNFITTTHWDKNTIPMTMPNPGLTREDTAAVAGYILSLRTRSST